MKNESIVRPLKIKQSLSRLPSISKEDLNFYDSMDHESIHSLIETIEEKLLTYRCILDGCKKLVGEKKIIDEKIHSYISGNARMLRIHNRDLRYIVQRMNKSFEFMEMYGLDPNEEQSDNPQ